MSVSGDTVAQQTGPTRNDETDPIALCPPTVRASGSAAHLMVNIIDESLNKTKKMQKAGVAQAVEECRKREEAMLMIDRYITHSQIHDLYGREGLSIDLDRGCRRSHQPDDSTDGRPTPPSVFGGGGRPPSAAHSTSGASNAPGPGQNPNQSQNSAQAQASGQNPNPPPVPQTPSQSCSSENFNPHLVNHKPIVFAKPVKEQPPAYQAHVPVGNGMEKIPRDHIATLLLSNWNPMFSLVTEINPYNDQACLREVLPGGSVITKPTFDFICDIADSLLSEVLLKICTVMVRKGEDPRTTDIKIEDVRGGLQLLDLSHKNL